MIKTRDIYEAAALVSLGATIEKVDREDKQHQEFHLECVPTPIANLPMDILEVWHMDYMNGRLMVNATKFSESIRKMKSIIHS